MATLTKRTRDFRGVRGLARPSFLQENDYEGANLEALRGIISYLNYLYTEGEISDKAYKTLVSQILSTFVENAIHFKVEQMLGEVDATLKEANEVLLKNILS
jgi:hypothetical protein